MISIQPYYGYYCSIIDVLSPWPACTLVYVSTTLLWSKVQQSLRCARSLSSLLRPIDLSYDNNRHSPNTLKFITRLLSRWRSEFDSRFRRFLAAIWISNSEYGTERYALTHLPKKPSIVRSHPIDITAYIDAYYPLRLMVTRSTLI